MPWNKICMIWIIWQLPVGHSRELWICSLPSDHDPSGGASPPPNFENRFVLKWFLGDFKCLKLMFHMLTPPTHLNGIFHYFFFKPSLKIYVFPWYINYRSNQNPFHIMYCSLKLFKLSLLKKKDRMIYVFPWIFINYIIESISIPYCALDSIALLTIFVKNGPYDLCFPLEID